MAQLTIPTPCTEDWNQMTPSAKGAFCQKCQVDVMDFTEKTNEEIKNFFQRNKGKKTCGHIRQAQLANFNNSYANWENQSTQTFWSKFLWACMITFGMTLFTGCETTDDSYDVMGEMEYVHPDSTATDCRSKNDLSTYTDSVCEPDFPNHVLIDGEMEFIDEE